MEIYLISQTKLYLGERGLYVLPQGNIWKQSTPTFIFSIGDGFFSLGARLWDVSFTKLYIKLFTYPAYSFLLSSLICFCNRMKNMVLFAWACLFAWTMLYFMEIHHHSALFICLLLLRCLYSCMTMQPCHIFSLLNGLWLEIGNRRGGKDI